MKRIRVAVVDDASTVRVLLRGALEVDPRFEVVGEFDRAETLLEVLEALLPDLILMDVVLPGIDGLEAVRRIMRTRPIPIVVVSGTSRAADPTLAIAALSAGALSVVEKPRLDSGNERMLESFSRRLRRQVAALNGVRLVRQRGSGCGLARRGSAPARHFGAAAPGRQELDLLGLVASTGGPAALQRVLNDLGPDFPLPIAVVQHISTAFATGFARWLASVVPFEVEVASEHGIEFAPGVVVVAPPDRHLRVTGRAVQAWDGLAETWQRPSGNVLLGSMADALGARGIGVVLTGMGVDGSQGLLALRATGALTIAEDASSTVVDGMPRAARARGAASESWPLARIGPRLRTVVLGDAEPEVARAAKGAAP